MTVEQQEAWDKKRQEIEKETENLANKYEQEIQTQGEAYVGTSLSTYRYASKLLNKLYYDRKIILADNRGDRLKKIADEIDEYFWRQDKLDLLCITKKWIYFYKN
jgi:uncharacterized protein